MSEGLRSLKYVRASIKEINDALKNPQMKIGELARIALSSILQHPNFPEVYLERFRSKDFSFMHFKLSYPLLIRHREWSKELPYYADYIECHGKLYCLCNAWFEKSRPFLEAWINENKIDETEERHLWSLERAPRIMPSETITVASENRIRSAEKSSGKKKWVITVGKIKDGVLDEFLPIFIKKIDIETAARLKMKCVLRLKNHTKSRLYTIDSREIDIAVWRDKSIFSRNESWGFLLNLHNGELFSYKDNPRLKVGNCRILETSKPVRDYVSKITTRVPWVNYEAKPVHPVRYSLAEMQRCESVEVARNNRALRNTREKESKVKHTKIQSNKLGKKQESDLMVSVPCIEDGERLVCVYIKEEELRLRLRRCCVFNTVSGKSYRIKSKLLLDKLEEKHIFPINYSDSRGRCWSFYFDCNRGEIYKSYSDTAPILRLL